MPEMIDTVHNNRFLKEIKFYQSFKTGVLHERLLSQCFLFSIITPFWLSVFLRRDTAFIIQPYFNSPRYPVTDFLFTGEIFY